MTIDDVMREIDRARDLLKEVRNTLEHAMFAIEIMRPLTNDDQIIGPLNRTYAANTLNALTWALYSQAGVDACKAILDGDGRSASLSVVIRMLSRPEVLAVLREVRTAPVRVDIDADEDLSADEIRRFEVEFMQQEQARAGAEFDTQMPRALARYTEILGEPAVGRLKDARNKIMAHTDAVLDGETYRRCDPSDYGLKWGDVEHVIRLGAELTSELMIAAFAHDIGIDDSRRIYAQYSEDFWRHLRAGLQTVAK